MLPVGPGDKCYPCGGLGDSIIISFSLGGTAYYKGGGRNILAGVKEGLRHILLLKKKILFFLVQLNSWVQVSKLTWRCVPEEEAGRSVQVTSYLVRCNSCAGYFPPG